MTSRRLLSVTTAFAVACVPAILLAQQATGVIGGHAGRQFAPRFTDYTVQLRDVQSGRPVLTKALDADGGFSFPGLALNQRYLVEIYQTQRNALVCTEGPFQLLPDTAPQKTDVTIECGKTPAILWLLVAGAGTASAVAVSTASGSR